MEQSVEQSFGEAWFPVFVLAVRQIALKSTHKKVCRAPFLESWDAFPRKHHRTINCLQIRSAVPEKIVLT